MIERPILVTGSHRSGSTWVGKILSQAPKAYYVAEPFNPKHVSRSYPTPLKYWFHYVTPQEDADFDSYASHCIGISYQKSYTDSSGYTWKDNYRHTKAYCKLWLRHFFHEIPIIKDPIAFFSAEWIAKKFDAKVLVLIRHPAAFVCSLKRANWHFPFKDLLMQSQLMEEQLEAFRDEIWVYSNQEQDIIDQGILLWRIIHATIARYKQDNPSWIFIRHEDLSYAPSREFQKLFLDLNLPFTQTVQDSIKAYSTLASSTSFPSSSRDLYRDSRANIWIWRQYLSSSEIQHIKKASTDIAQFFYREQDWSSEV